MTLPHLPRGPENSSSSAPYWHYLVILVIPAVLWLINPNWLFQNLGHTDPWYYFGEFWHFPHFQSLLPTYAGERMTTQINFDNEASDTRTLIEIQTEDRLGLLYAISQTFSEQALDIARARIVTERGAAIDSFYVTELDGGKVMSAERQKQIERGLRQAIHRLETAK